MTQSFVVPVMDSVAPDQIAGMRSRFWSYAVLTWHKTDFRMIGVFFSLSLSFSLSFSLSLSLPLSIYIYIFFLPYLQYQVYTIKEYVCIQYVHLVKEKQNLMSGQ